MSLPSSVSGLGQTDGLDFWIRDVNGQGRQYLEREFKQLQEQAKQYTTFLENLDKRSNPDKAELKVNVDQKLAMANGLSQAAINSTLSSAWGGSYINDFIDRGRIKRVMMQGDAEFRSKPEDLHYWSVRNDLNQMVSFSHFANVTWSGGPEVVNRYMGYTALQMEADTAKNVSSGVAMQDVSQLVEQQSGIDVAWSGLSFEEQNQVTNHCCYIWCRLALFFYA